MLSTKSFFLVDSIFSKKRKTLMKSCILFDIILKKLFRSIKYRELTNFKSRTNCLFEFDYHRSRQLFDLQQKKLMKKKHIVLKKSETEQSKSNSKTTKRLIEFSLHEQRSMFDK